MRATDHVNKIMTAAVAWIDVDAPVTEMLRLLAEYPVHHLPVLNQGAVVGMLSSADVAKLKSFLPAQGPSRAHLLDTKFHVRMLMRTPVVTVFEHDTVKRAAELMVRNAVHALPVVNQNGRLTGIITTTDVMAAYLGRLEDNLVHPLQRKDDVGGGELSAAHHTYERQIALEKVAHTARRYLNAGQDQQLHAELTLALDEADRTTYTTAPRTAAL